MIHRQIDRLSAGLQAAATDEQGQGLVEYALMLLLVALAVIGTMTILGTSLDDTIQLVVDVFP